MGIETVELLDELELQDDDGRTKLEAFFTELKPEPSAEINIYQVDAQRPSHKGYLFALAPGEMTSTELFNYVRDQFGDGLYEAQGRADRAKEDGSVAKNLLVFRQQFRIGPVKPARFARPGKTDARAPAGGDTSAILQAVAGMQQATVAAIERLATAMTTQGQSALDKAKELEVYKNLFTPAAPGGSFLETVRDVLAIRSELSGDGEGSDPLSMAVSKLVPAITGAVERMDMNERRRRPAGPGTPRAPGTSVDQQLAWMLGKALPSGITAAVAGIEPRQAAVLIVGQIADNQVLRHALVAYLDDDLVVDKLAKINSGVLAHREWFDTLADELLEILHPEGIAAAAAAEQAFADELEGGGGDAGELADVTPETPLEERGPEGAPEGTVLGTEAIAIGAGAGVTTEATAAEIPKSPPLGQPKEKPGSLGREVADWDPAPPDQGDYRDSGTVGRTVEEWKP